MRFFFVDESGNSAMGGTKFLVLAGLVLRDDDWPRIQGQYDSLKTEFGIHPNIEVKWRHVRHPGGHRNPLRTLTDVERTHFGMRTLGLLRQTAHARVVSIIIDKVAAYARPDIASEEDIYERAVSLAMERYQYFLRATHSFGIVVQDQRLPGQDIKLRAFYRGLLTTGTRWTRFPNILEGVFLTPSDYSTGIQIADFVAGACYAAHCSEKSDLKYFNVIRGKITGDPRSGKRHGLKRWP